MRGFSMVLVIEISPTHAVLDRVFNRARHSHLVNCHSAWCHLRWHKGVLERPQLWVLRVTVTIWIQSYKKVPANFLGTVLAWHRQPSVHCRYFTWTLRYTG